MSKPTVIVHCKIIDYIARKNPTFAELLGHLCITESLSSKYRHGVTLLMPNQGTLDEIYKKAYSAKPEDRDVACKIIRAHIMRNVYKDVASWKSGEVSNMLFPSQIVTVDPKSGTSVKFTHDGKSIGEAKIAADFIDGSDRKVLAVWDMISGAIPVTEGRDAAKLPPVDKNKPKQGSYEPTDSEASILRYRIGIAAENEFALYWSARCTGATTTMINPLISYVNSLYYYIKHVEGRTDVISQLVCPMLAFDESDFYMLIEPHRFRGKALISDNTITEWWAWRRTNVLTLASLNEMQADLAKIAKPTVFSDYASIRRAMTIDARDQSENVNGLISKIKSLYAKLESTNTVEYDGKRIENVYPQMLADFYRENPGLKLVHDDTRYYIHRMICRTRAVFNYSAYHSITNTIGDNLLLRNGSTGKTMLFDTPIGDLFINDFLYEILSFVNSAYFLFTAVTEEIAKSPLVKASSNLPSRNQVFLYNIPGFNYARYPPHFRIGSRDEPVAADKITKMLLGMESSMFSDELKTAIKNKFA